MNGSDTLIQLYQPIAFISMVASLVLGYQYVRIVFVRRTPYPWTALAAAAFLLAVAWERSVELLSPQLPATPPQFAGQLGTDGVIVLTVLLLPLLLRPIYGRLKISDLKNIHRRLEYSQHLFTAFMDAMPIMAFIKNSRSRYVYINHYLSDAFEIPVEEALGRHTLPWASPTVARAMRRHERKVFSLQTKEEFFETMRLKGKVSIFYWIEFPLIGPNGETLLGGISVDVTERKAITNRIDVLASIIDLSPDAIFSLDEDGIMQSWNPAAAEMFGFQADEILGRSIYELVPEDKRSAITTQLRLLREAGNVADFETALIARDGIRKFVAVAAANVPRPGSKGYICGMIVRDLTRKKEIEEQIHTLNQQLQVQLLALSQTNENLKVARDQALEATEQKSAFVANISHELRTPLSGILGTSELLLEKPLSADFRQTISTIQDAGYSLLSTINEILDLSRLEAGKVHVDFEPYNPIKLIKNSVQAIQDSAERKHLKLKMILDQRLPEQAYGDSTKMAYVLDCLLNNSVKFTEQGTVTVDVALTQDNGKIHFSVMDTGLGIPYEKKQWIFTPFFRTIQSPASTAGLGLAISKLYVELMGGEISFESIKGDGSCFWFEVPLCTPPSEVRVSAGESREVGAQITTTDLASKKVLSVEDSPVLAALTLRQLSLMGVSTDGAMTGTEAVNKACKEAFDIILMDLHLPDISGYEATSLIRECERQLARKPAVIIALTAGGTVEDRERGLQAGMNDFLIKPVTIKQLRDRIYSWLSR